LVFYQAKGVLKTQARVLADQLMSNKNTALDTLVREELGIDADDLGGSAWGAGSLFLLPFCDRRIFAHYRFLIPDGHHCDHCQHCFELCRPVWVRRRHTPLPAVASCFRDCAKSE
jgi:hypothetical protein